MKNKIIVLALLAVTAFFAPVMAEKFVFTEYGVSYGSMITPRNIENNSTGTYDTALFDAKAGVSICRWAEVYIGGSFQPFIFTANPQENCSFLPVYAGIKANIFPSWPVYPGLMFEYGKAAANIHSQYEVVYGPNTALFDRDSSWVADYYNFGFSVNWNVEDIAVLSLRIERPSYSNISTVKGQGEIQVFKAGLAWQIYY